ncbi:AraC family transcriptional regulator [Rubellicoccus peritrichatus]|uniref:AraC family transcriptional regulator n=1 Tax=Rubellicoccus peritrichatus TaxID=3080537 RepID=A0AAQ3LEV2_9BACT|nr:AraC family transcriptional regulator [Puniceicoccus sp. CR14]WOO42358.1 AraC family transcriptional regulator [Puniceicoccus sp. CR14]
MSLSSNSRYMITGEEIDFPVVEHMGVNLYGEAVALHGHEHDGYEFVFVLDGELNYEIIGTGEVIVIRGGQYSCMAPGIHHQAYRGYETPCLSAWIIFRPAQKPATHNSTFLPQEIEQMKAQLDDCRMSVQSYGGHTRHTLKRFKKALAQYHSANAPAGSLALIKSIACELIIDGVHQLISLGEPGDITYAEAAQEYINSHLYEPLKVADIAKHLGYSLSRTYTLFRNHTGQSPVDYITRQRINAAEKLLKNSKLSVSDIAFKCGFNSSQYFSRTFRRYNGLSPSAFRGSGD